MEILTEVREVEAVQFQQHQAFKELESLGRVLVEERELSGSLQLVVAVEPAQLEAML
jgi:hypothetical protein